MKLIKFLKEKRYFFMEMESISENMKIQYRMADKFSKIVATSYNLDCF